MTAITLSDEVRDQELDNWESVRPRRGCWLPACLACQARQVRPSKSSGGGRGAAGRCRALRSRGLMQADAG